MIAIVLAAGYGTRLGALGADYPKALIKVRGESLLSRVCQELESIPQLRGIMIVSNDLYYDQLRRWARARATASAEVLVTNDGTRSPAERLGAIGDLALAIRRLSTAEPIFVAASDCYFTFSLRDMHERFDAHGGNWIAARREKELAALAAAAVLEVDDDSNVTFMQEKPAQPRSTLGALPFYIYEASTLGLIEEYLARGGDPDSPGRFPEWLYRRRQLSAYIVDARYDCQDLGTPEAYAKWAGPVAAGR